MKDLIQKILLRRTIIYPGSIVALKGHIDSGKKQPFKVSWVLENEFRSSSSYFNSVVLGSISNSGKDFI